MSDAIATGGRRWKVSFTAKRKVVRYERRELSPEITEEQVRTLLDLHEGEIDPDTLRDALHELAEDGTRYSTDVPWTFYLQDDEELDPADQEIEEIVEPATETP